LQFRECVNLIDNKFNIPENVSNIKSAFNMFHISLLHKNKYILFPFFSKLSAVRFDLIPLTPRPGQTIFGSV
jgi:hypothetical protein